MPRNMIIAVGKMPPLPLASSEPHGQFVLLHYEAYLREDFCVTTAQLWSTLPLTQSRLSVSGTSLGAVRGQLPQTLANPW